MHSHFLSTSPPPPPPPSPLSIFLSPHHFQINTLATFSSSPPPGITRVLFTPEDAKARAYIRGLMVEAGLQITEDGVGNMRGRWTGTDPLRGGVASGSHADAIPGSGRYDGTVGVLGAIAAIKALKAVGYQPVRTLEAILFTSEEPTRFGLSCIGSRAMAGFLAADRLEALRDANGTTFLEAARAAGYGHGTGRGRNGGAAPPAHAVLRGCRIGLGVITHFLELHIEQGPALEAAGAPLGLVTAIAAPASLRVTFTGPGGHAGTVPMRERRDPGLAAAELALAVEAAVAVAGEGSPHAVATVGSVSLFPGATNAIPTAATLSVDLRDIDGPRRDGALRAVRKAARAIGRARRVGVAVETLTADPPMPTDVEVQAAAARAIAAVTPRATKGGGPGAVPRLVSGAYHDALAMARAFRSGMIFIRCRGGLSHVPGEYASPADMAAGVAALALALGDLGAGPPLVGRDAGRVARERGATHATCPVTGRVDDGGGGACPFRSKERKERKADKAAA